MKKIREVISLIRVNARTMAEFEILYKILSLALFTPLFVGIFNGIMRITGYRYLTIENIVPFFTNPLTIAALTVLFVCMTVYAMIDIGAVIFLLDCSYQGKKADLVQTLRFSVPNAVRVFHRKNISVAFPGSVRGHIQVLRCAGTGEGMRQPHSDCVRYEHCLR